MLIGEIKSRRKCFRFNDHDAIVISSILIVIFGKTGDIDCSSFASILYF
ncbi:hypothetical protein CT0354 [Chlorobaculum tepidum TLS]|uniref:Uncharacterized protein n=1 Tax=Chlorobaculum tepidum (strain ATCC 49652 / DSM 12025 / NBRC 103806 / TLS) TaxID=194439 RepID=Q8KFH2_CHLTE|nr:hypothetical protein CT0354 [Chlorobaculum tepidum TLS]